MMTPQLLRAAVAGFCMLITAGVTYALTPTRKLADDRPPIDLERMIPRSFGGWQVDPTMVPVTVSPDVQAKLDKIYNQTLSRTYLGPRGERVMLVIAYGGDQSDAMRAHRPEVCYSAQGFQVSSMIRGALDIATGELPVMRLVATHGSRNEPITYWMTVGDEAVLTSTEQKLAQLRYGFAGSIPDGLLVRVSSINRDPQTAYQTQAAFSGDLMAAVTPAVRARLVGQAVAGPVRK